MEVPNFLAKSELFRNLYNNILKENRYINEDDDEDDDEEDDIINRKYLTKSMMNYYKIFEKQILLNT